MPFSTRHLVSAKIALLIVITCAAYLPALQGGFVFDDETLLSKNLLVNASDGIFRLWFTNQAIDYWPMTNSTFWIEWRMWGKNSTGYHVTNLALHIAAALLVWRVLYELAIPGAFLAGLLFAVHPVNVESVAWISQRKNVLAMVFFLLSILWYLDQEEEQSRGGAEQKRGFGLWYWLSLAMFLLAMLSKGSVAVLPVLLVLVVWWRKGRIERGDLWRIAPFLAVAIVLTAVNLWFRTHGAEFVVRNAGTAERAAGAGAAIWFYLSKALLPIRLVFIYPQWHIEVGELLWWLPLLAALVATAVLARRGFSAGSPWGRALLFAWGCFCVALVPVLGFTDVGAMQYSLVADHYEYIAVVAVAAVVAAGWRVWQDGSRGITRLAASVVAVAMVAMLTSLTFAESRLYRDAATLYEATLRNNPDCWVAHNNLGTQLAEAGRRAEAIQQFEEALRLKPDYAQAHYNIGNNLGKTDPAAAIEQYREALRIDPDYVEARNNLGIILCRVGRTDEAVECLKEGIKIQPQRAVTYFNLGNVYSEANRPEEAVEQYLQALRLKPNYAEAWANIAGAYGDLNRWDEALAAANKGLELARAQGLAGVARGIEGWRAANATKLTPAAKAPSIQTRP